MTDSRDIFGAVAVSSTGTYKSLVSDATQAGQRHFYAVKSTSDAAGTLSREVNVLPELVYRAAVAAQAGATWAAKEAANTTGWVSQSLLQSDVTNAGATVAIAAAAGFCFNMPPGPRRSRLSYTNASGSGALSAYLQLS